MAAARFTLAVTVQSVTALNTCDDVFQGITVGEFGVRVLGVPSGGNQHTFVETPQYPGDPAKLQAIELAQGASQAFNRNQSFTLNGESGQSLRIQFNATEWDEQVVVFPPSIRFIHDSRLSDASISRTHSYSNGTFGALGPNTLTLGNSSCGIRLNYTISASR